jgi:SAM-dependent methyltransferase
MKSRSIKATVLAHLPEYVRNTLYSLKRNLIVHPRRRRQFWRQYAEFEKQSRSPRFPLRKENVWQFLDDATPTTGFDAHYLYHPAWAARIIAKTRPKKHVDIASTLHFSALVSAFVPVDFYDIRPANVQLSNFESKAGNLTELPLANNSVDSLSCLHTLEHVGLGRYGDTVDPDGDLKAARELSRVLAPGGNLLVAMPVGKEKLQFNAHRVYSYQTGLDLFPDLVLKGFTLIPDSAVEIGIIEDASSEMVNSQEYGCGCFWFTK